MNKLFKCLSTAILGIAMAVGVGVGVSSGVKVNEVKAATTTYTFTSKSDPKDITSSPSAGNYENSRGAQWSNNEGLTISTSSSISDVTKVEFVTSTNANDNAYSISCKVGDSDFGSTIKMKKENNQNLSFTGSATTGVVSINFTLNGTKKSIYMKSITITTGASTPTTTYTVTFDAKGHGTAPTAQTVGAGAKVTKPTDPTESGWTFGGWYKETGCTDAWDFDTDTVNDNLTLYAKWTQGGPTPTPSGDYILVTKVSQLSDGDKVLIAIAGTSGPSTGVTGMNSNDKDATVSLNSSDWILFNVELSNGGFKLSYNTSYINFVEKAISYGTASVLSVTTAGYICLGSDNTIILFNQSTFYRPYKGKLGADGYTPFSVYKVGESKSLELISTLSGQVSAKTGDTSWTITNVTVTGVLNDSPAVVDVSDYVNVSVVEAVPTIDETKTMNVTLKAAGKKDATIYKSVSVVATLKFINPYDLRQIYGSEDDTTVTIDGIYMGDVRDAMIIMDGEYGANIYYGTGKVPAHSYVPGVTKLTVTGTTTLYKGLEEVKPTSVSVLTDQSRIDRLQIPQTYICTGDESSEHPELASRKTHATGYVTAISDASGNKNVTLKVNGKSIAIFIGSVYATEDVMTKLNDSKENETNITIEGFTSFYYNAFQVQFTGLVEQKVDYLAENFAQDLLDLTDDVCEGYDGVTNNKDALAAVWLVLQDADHYLGLSEIEKAKLVAADADETGDVVERAMARYDYLVAKYSLSNFITRSTITISSGVNFMNVNSNTTIIALIAVIALSVVGGYIYIRRRKEY